MLVIFDTMDSAKNLKKRNVVTCKLLYGKKKMEEAGLRTGKRILATAGKMPEKCQAVSPSPN